MKYLIANWKMVLTAKEGLELVHSVKDDILQKDKNLSFGIAAPATHLSPLSDNAKTLGFRLGTQNIHWDICGAYTGEISVNMAKEFGADFSLVGHSERRHIFKEDNEMIEKRFVGASNQGILPILCVGETLKEREESRTTKVLSKQLEFLENSKDSKFIIAYEPVWAIGTGKTATAIEIAAAHKFIHGFLSDSLKQTPILYGGSITPDNFEEIINIEFVSGGLVGGASCDKGKLSKLLKTRIDS